MDFKERIGSLKDQEIIKILKTKDEYQEEFWELCVLEAEKRGLKGIQQIIDDLNKFKLEKQRLKDEKEKKEANLLELYSERTIIIFSSLFTPLAGSILFAMNLKKLDKKDIESVIGIGLLYTVVILILGFLLPLGGMKSLGYLLNIVAGFVMIFQFSNKYYPENFEYKKKNAFLAYLIGFSIVLFAVFIIYLNTIL